MIHPLIQEKVKALAEHFVFTHTGEELVTKTLTDVMEAGRHEESHNTDVQFAEFLKGDGTNESQRMLNIIKAEGVKEERERILAALPLSAPTKNGIANDLNDGYNAAIVAVRSIISNVHRTHLSSPSKDTV